MFLRRAAIASGVLIATAFLARSVALLPPVEDLRLVTLDLRIASSGLLCLVLSALLVTAWLFVTRLQTPFLLWIAVSGNIVAAIVLVLAVSPRLVSQTDASLMAPGSFKNITNLSVSNPVFFSNGVRKLNDGDAKRLRGYFESVAACTGTKVSIVGFASSLGYEGDQDDAKNRDLANDRATAVALTASAAGIGDVDAKKWPTAGAMAKARGVIDHEANGKRAPLRELLNRRADITLKLPPECVDSEK